MSIGNSKPFQPFEPFVRNFGHSRLLQAKHRHGVATAQIPVAWAIAKGALPIVGATKVRHVEDAVKAANLVLSADEIKEMEELAAAPGLQIVRGWEKEMK